jgi:hypothetical protein
VGVDQGAVLVAAARLILNRLHSASSELYIPGSASWPWPRCRSTALPGSARPHLLQLEIDERAVEGGVVGDDDAVADELDELVGDLVMNFGLPVRKARQMPCTFSASTGMSRRGRNIRGTSGRSA